jgi:hypothetical protein
VAIPWSENHKAILARSGMTLDKASRLTGRSRAACRQQAENLGIRLYQGESVTQQDMPPHAPQSPETHDTPDMASVVDMALDMADTFEFDGEPTTEQMDALLDAMAALDSAVTGLAPTRDSVTLAPSDPHLPVGIIFTGDWHAGAGGVELDRLRRDLRRIGETDGLYGIAMGDLVEGVGAGNKAAPALYSGIVNKSDVQVALAVHLANLAKGKWLCVIDGNHDQFAYNATGIDRGAAIGRGIGVPRFGQGGATVFVELNGTRYVVGVRHNGKGNSQINTTNAQRRTFDEWPNWDNCDVICLAHLHYNDLHIPPRKAGQCIYLRSGSAKTHDSYAKDHGYTPEYGMPVVVFYPDTKEMVPFRGDRMDAALRFLAMERERYAHTSRIA